MKKAVFTSCNLDYLDRAVVLADSFKQFNPDVDFVLVLSDHVDIVYLGDSVFDSFDLVIGSHDLGIDRFLPWSFQMTVVELCTAVKAQAFVYLFANEYDQVLYLDPDIACFESLGFMFEELNSASILLTPHQLRPAKNIQQFIDNELCSFKHGIFNLGFLGLKNSESGAAFLGWWANRLYSWCRDDIPNGIFTDQKWCDAVPAFFHDHKVIRHPGCNVASWNLCERILTIDSDAIKVNESEPLVFYHYTKYFSEGAAMTKRYLSSAASISVWNWYGRQIRLVQARMAKPPFKGKYSFFRSGKLIEGPHRSKWRELFPLSEYSDLDPYDDSLHKLFC
jgi:hypothetical protein